MGGGDIFGGGIAGGLGSRGTLVSGGAAGGKTGRWGGTGGGTGGGIWGRITTLVPFPRVAFPPVGGGKEKLGDRGVGTGEGNSTGTSMGDGFTFGSPDVGGVGKTRGEGLTVGEGKRVGVGVTGSGEGDRIFSSWLSTPLTSARLFSSAWRARM